eukprot:2914443-Prymnesium_polylepis.1
MLQCRARETLAQTRRGASSRSEERPMTTHSLLKCSIPRSASEDVNKQMRLAAIRCASNDLSRVQDSRVVRL